MLMSFKSRVQSIVRRLKIGRQWDGCTLADVCRWGFFLSEGTKLPADAPQGVRRLVAGVGLRGILYDLAQPARLRGNLEDCRTTNQPDRETRQQELLEELKTAETRAAETRLAWDLPSEMTHEELLERLREIGRKQGLSPDELVILDP